MLEYLVDLIARLGHWGYLIIFLVAVMESAVFLGLFLPGETIVVTAGFMAAQRVLDLDGVIVTVALGASIGDSIGFELGRRLGRPWAERYGARFGMTDEHLKKGEGFFARHGGKAVLLGRFVHFARVLVPFLAGSSRLPYATFAFYNVLGATLWACAAALLGYFMGHLSERWLGRASAILGGLVLFGFLLGWLWHWISAHQGRIKARWGRIQQRPLIATSLQRFGPQLRWLRRRLSPGEYLGLQLTSAVLLFVGAAWIFGGVMQDVMAGDPLTILDKKIEIWFAHHQERQVTAFMSAVSWLHTWPIGAAAVALLAHLVWQRAWRWAAIALGVVPGGMLLNTLVKLAVHRERPTLSGLSAALRTYSFPSGHTMGAALIYGLLAMYLMSRTKSWDQRVAMGTGAFFLVVIVALSRIYLGVHYLSDVLAAMAEAVAWLMLCHTAVTTLWHRPNKSQRTFGDQP